MFVYYRYQEDRWLEFVESVHIQACLTVSKTVLSDSVRDFFSTLDYSREADRIIHHISIEALEHFHTTWIKRLDKLNLC